MKEYLENKKLWYGSDEVKEFHPVIKLLINEILINNDLNNKYQVKHHSGEHTSGIPDFVMIQKNTSDYILVIEVKKTPSDVLSKESGKQAMDYAKELRLRWKTNCPVYFCVTNIEYTQLYCLRDGNTSLIGCLQEGSPFIAGDLSEARTYLKFKDIFSNIIKMIDSRTAPKYSSYLDTISESFNYSFYTIATILDVNLQRISNYIDANELQRQNILYELLRFCFYYYIKDFYDLNNSKLKSNFESFNISLSTTSEGLIEATNKKFSKAKEIDFVDILSDNEYKRSILSDKILNDSNLLEIFINYIRTLENNSLEGIRKNSDVLNYISLITSQIYDKEQMHKQGKIMSDEILSTLLAQLTIDDPNSKILDPCSGDGNLLLASYNYLKEIDPNKNHNQLLDQLYGIEIDPNLIQLAAFKIISKNLNEINNQTKTHFIKNDLFNLKLEQKYDSIVMNPPFLRNEDVNIDIKERYLKNIELEISGASFIRDVKQPNLYFYFIEKCIQLLRDDGRASIILMSKFLNNKDGEHLKKFLLPYVKLVLMYPADFFDGFSVTTCIVVLDKKDNSDLDISFLRVKEVDLLSDINKIKDMLENSSNIDNESFSLAKKRRKNLDPSSNWRLFFIDPMNKYEQLRNLEILTPLNNYFDSIGRGKAENSGGSKMIYINSSNNPLIDIVDNIEQEYIGYGLQRNKLNQGRRKIILTDDCLNNQKGLIFAEKFNDDNSLGLPEELENSKGFREYCLEMYKSLNNYKKVFNCCHKSMIFPEIIIPRADRTKHMVYYNPIKDKPVLISTNFFYLSNPNNNLNQSIEIDKQVKFIVAFLISSFGQLQFEIRANNQEGMRKIEGFMIEKLMVPDLNQISEEDMDIVVNELENLNNLNSDFLGNENEDDNIRNNLDASIARIIYATDDMGFDKLDDFISHIQSFLKEVVQWRIDEGN